MHYTGNLLKGIRKNVVKFEFELLRGVHHSRSYSTAHPEEQLIQPLPIFIGNRFPEQSQRVSVHFPNTSTDLQDRWNELEMVGCPPAIWRGQVPYCESCEHLGQQGCSAVFLPGTCPSCSHMYSATELVTFQLAMSSRLERRGRFPFWVHVVGARSLPGTGPETILMQRLDMIEETNKTNEEETEDRKKKKNDECTKLDPLHGCLRLTSAVRLDALEKQIERRLEADRQSMCAVSQHTSNLGSVSDCSFIAEDTLHELRYELHAEKRVLDAPDLPQEHASIERFHDQVILHFDVRRRIAILNERFGYSFEYLHTFAEHVRHLYSMRLERIVLVLIVLELCVGMMQLTRRLTLSTATHDGDSTQLGSE